VIRTLERVVPADDGKPVRPGAADNQRQVTALALDPTLWTPERAGETVRQYNEYAPNWNADRGSYRPVPLKDALARGGPWPTGWCVEVGSGTGILTPLLLDIWDRVVSIDLTLAMLARATAGRRVNADASRLPLADSAAEVVVLGDAPLFADEVDRVLAPGGALIWSNALGCDAPFHVPTSLVLQALPGDWEAVESEAGWGSWAVFRRS
jgi:SAM-dependent methyltransferase